MGYIGNIKAYRNRDLSDAEKLEAIIKFRDVLKRNGIIPPSPNGKEFHKREASSELSYEGPLVLDYRIVDQLLRENYELCLFSELVHRISEYEEVKGSIQQIETALLGVLAEFPLGLLCYHSKYHTLSWLYFRKIVMGKQ